MDILLKTHFRLPLCRSGMVGVLTSGDNRCPTPWLHTCFDPGFIRGPDNTPSWASPRTIEGLASPVSESDVYNIRTLFAERRMEKLQ